jgi:SPP1 family predicted phage head-tail adaptor
VIQPAGQLDQRITIEHKAVARNAIGEEVETWSAFATVWARYLPARVDERLAGAQLQGEFEARFRIRRLAGVDPEMRVTWRGERYDLAGPAVPVDGRGRLVDLYVRRGVRDGR